jgi:stage V sporulation protein G
LDITEVRVKLADYHDDKLHAFASITIDNQFVIRDLKIIEGANGVFVAMPSRKLTGRCARCGGKNHLRARFCNDCGSRQPAPRTDGGRTKLHADIAHPIDPVCREQIENEVVRVYEEELELARKAGRVPESFFTTRVTGRRATGRVSANDSTIED